MSITSDLEADYQRYRAICAQRTQQAAQAARRDDLQAQLTNRQQAEAQAADASRRRANAKEALRAAAKDCLIPQAETADLDALAAGLETWLKHRLQSLAQRDQAAGDYAVLQNLLEGGKTLEDLHEEADRLAAAADRAAANQDAAEIAAANLGPDPVETLQKLRAATQEARDQRTGLQTTKQERERSAPGVPASQEAAAQAAQRVAQLEHLSRVLSSAPALLPISRTPAMAPAESVQRGRTRAPSDVLLPVGECLLDGGEADPFLLQADGRSVGIRDEVRVQG